MKSKIPLQTKVSNGIFPQSGATHAPTENVALRAYRKYENGGYVHGNDVQHWLEAECELAAMSKSP